MGTCLDALEDYFPLGYHVHERYFGLFRWNGLAKGAAGLIPAVDRRREEKEPCWGWIDIKPEDYYQHPLEHLERLYRNFKDRFDQF